MNLDRLRRRGCGVALLLVGLLSPLAGAAATGWIPPPRITVAFPGASIAPGSSHTLQFTVRSNGVPADLVWSATGAGQFVPTLTPSSGSLSLAADATASVSLLIGVPSAAIGAGLVTVEIFASPGAHRLAKASATILAATLGRPEVWPAPSTWTAPSGTSGSVVFEVKSQQGTAETVSLTTGRSNPDPNNMGALFPGPSGPPDVLLPALGTVTVSIPTTVAASAYGGNLNAITLSVSSVEGISSATGHAVSSASLPDSLPAALIPTGLIPAGEPLAGRDGPVHMPARDVWLSPCGLDGVLVARASALAEIGPRDLNANGIDDRWVGRVRIPAYAAALSVLPGFVTTTGDTMDLGLLAAGRAGLMLLDLRVVEDPPFGTWEDNFDGDANGIDDRILRTIPMPGFATDVAWFRAPSGRVVALVADADTGSVPVAATYDPALVAAGTGAGIVAVDVAAALDSLGGISYAAGTLATSGSALDLELRGGNAPDLAIADGSGGVTVYHLVPASGAPATVTFVPRGSVALSSAWGAPYARDLAWISNTSDSSYLAVAAGAAGIQIVRAIPATAPALVLAQQAAAATSGLAGAWTGTLAAAMGGGGVALLRAPSAAELDQIAPAAAPPYTAPVVLSRGQTWTEGAPLEVASHWTPSASATSLKFFTTVGPIPDLLVSDGTRLLLLDPGATTLTAVLPDPPSRAAPLALWPNAPNPFNPTTRITYSLPRVARVRLSVHDVQGRLVATLVKSVEGPGLHSALWDGRDAGGREAASGVYFLLLDSEGAVKRGKVVLAR